MARGKCITCGADWGGLKTSHCMRCHHTFSTVGNFDSHQAGGGKCQEPEDVGLTLLEGRPYPCYGQAADSEWADKFKKDDET